MKYGWKIALAAGLLLIVGYAAGIVGAVSATVAFSIASFLQWADKLGFAGARKQLGPDKFTVPVWKADNWRQLGVVLDDQEKFERSLTCSVLLIALLLTLPTTMVLAAALAVAGWFTFQVYRSQTARAGQTGSTT
jgi:hypothetical protein